MPLILAALLSAQALVAQRTASLEDLSHSFAKAMGTPNHPRAFTRCPAGKFRLLVESTSPPTTEVPTRTWAPELRRLETDFLAFLPIPNALAVQAGSLDVIVLSSRARYDRYLRTLPRGQASSVHGHFEPANLRIVLPANADLKTLRHEATHLLLDAYRPKALRSGVRVFWFEEGLAEYLAGVPDSEGRYRPGLDRRALSQATATLRPTKAGASSPSAPAPPLTLRQLLDATIVTANGWIANPSGSPHPQQVTQQAVAFIEFLVARSPQGPPSGSAASTTNALRTYLSYQLQGSSGAPYNDRAAFRQALGLESSKAFSAFEREWQLAWPLLLQPRPAKAKLPLRPLR